MIEHFFCKIIPPSSIDLDSQGMQEHSGSGCSGAWSLRGMISPKCLILSPGFCCDQHPYSQLLTETNIGVSTARGRKCGHNAH